MIDRNAGLATPYTAVYIIFRKDGKMAFLLRTNTGWMNNHYGLPAGRVEKGESFLAAALREAEEEVGVTLDPAKLKLILTGHRQDPDSTWVDIVFEATDWSQELYNAEPDIHGELVWLDPSKLPDNMVEYVRDYVEAIRAGKNYAEGGWE